MSQKLSSYRPDIDGLRALAVLFVVIFHAFPEVLRGGFVGVDVFFVISGYLISSILFENLDKNTFSLFRFYGKRVRRIFPALIVVLLFCVVSGYFLLFDDEYQRLGKHISGGSGFISNFLLWQESGYFDKTASLKPLLHLWSLGIEEQFYIFWPCLLFLAWRRSFNPWIFVGALCLVSFILNIMTIRHHATLTFYSPLMRAWELLLGALLAYRAHQTQALRPKFSWANETKALLGFLLLFLSVFLLNQNKLYPSGWALLPTLGTVLLISSAGSFINNKILSHPLMVGVGLISYPLYLWHWPLFAYAHIIFSNEAPVLLIWVLLGMSILLATVTYQWVEKPFRFNAHLEGQSVWILCVSLGFVGVLGIYISLNQGIQSRAFVVSQKAALLELNGFYAYKNQVHPCDLNTQDTKALSLCLKTQKGSPTHVLWGDSHAEHLLPGMISKDKNTNWLVIGHSGCPPLLNVEVFKTGRQDVCVKNNGIALKTILNTPSIDTVVLASLGPFYIQNTGYAAQHMGDESPSFWKVRLRQKRLDKTSKAALFYQGMDSAITQLEAHGKRVVLYHDVPEVSFMPEDCLKRPFAPNRQACHMDIESVKLRQKTYHALLLNLKRAYPQIEIFNPSTYLCDEAACYVRQNERFIYRDSHHLSLYGSELLAKPFLAWLNTDSHG